VPVFSRGPVPVSGLPAHAAIDSATSAAALRRTKTMCEAPIPLEAGDPPMPTLELIPKIRAKIKPGR